MSETFALTSLPLSGSLQRPMRWLAALTFIPFIATVVVLAAVVSHAPSTRAPPPLALLIAIPALVLLGQIVLVLRMRRIAVGIGGGELVVNTGLGTQRVALANLRKHGVRVIDLRAQPQLRPRVRTRGAGIPGLSSGWFRLRNGERALCVLLGRERVCYLRSDADGLSLLLSLNDPEALRMQLER